MNIEELNKAQLLLLTILVNFIISIAASILTVSLLDEAPPIVTQTVNRIVEQTVQTVTPGASSVVTKQTTVVDKQQDLVVAAIAAQVARTVTIHTVGATTTPVIAIGTYLPKSRAVVTAPNVLLPGQATIAFSNGTAFDASLAHSTNSVSIYGFADNAKLPGIVSPALVAAKDIAQGETVIALTANGSAVTGIVSRVEGNTVHTTLSGTPIGSSAVDIDGNLIGIAVDGSGLYTSAGAITTALTMPATATSQ